MIFGINTTSDISKLLYVIWNIMSGIFAKYHVQIMLLFVYTTTRKRFVIFTCRYFKLCWITTALSQSNCRSFSCSSIIDVTVKKDSLLVYVINFFGILAGRCGSLVVRERDQLLRPWVAIFFLFNRNVFSEKQVKNFLSVLKMAATVYERTTAYLPRLKIGHS